MQGLKVNGVVYELGGGGKPVVLWENPSPSASFAGQTITLADDVGNYDYIGVICAGGSNSADNRRRFAPLILSPTNVPVGGGASIAGYRNYRRNFTAEGNKMTFEDAGYYATYGTNTMTTANQYVIPRQVLGFK